MSDETAPQQPISTDENPEWYSHCCTDLSKVKRSGGRIDGMKAILVTASWLWDNGRTITVGFVDPVPGTPVQQDKVKEVVKEWEKHANLKFRFIPNGNDAEIRIGFREKAGSWSYIGKVALEIDKPEQTMNFGWVESTPETTAKERGVILHEFGHAIGYLHEHQSPRRGERLTLNEQVIIDYVQRTQIPPWTEEDARQNIINVYSRAEVSNFSAVDFTSIMMYFMPANWNVQGIEIPPNESLSPLDKAYAFLNYPFFIGTASSDPNVNILNSLNTAKVTGTARANIALEYIEGDWRGLRAEFTRWAVNQRALSDRAQAVSRREEAAAAVAAVAEVEAD
uniref:Peptidase M12A domain-containing protein n=1 Tax=Candolleomyces aberdarensis TaxID=2316362 RepID=A0A4Q2DAD1_9AGAR